MPPHGANKVKKKASRSTRRSSEHTASASAPKHVYVVVVTPMEEDFGEYLNPAFVLGAFLRRKNAERAKDAYLEENNLSESGSGEFGENLYMGDDEITGFDISITKTRLR